MSEDALARVLDDARVWRAGRQARHWPTLSSGHPELDALLPGGGWPAARLTEIAVARWGCGELALLLPAVVVILLVCATLGAAAIGQLRCADAARAAEWCLAMLAATGSGNEPQSEAAGSLSALI